eukprot:TRINITY_DN3191_c4_g5_i2.p1 TRINITY_DN3191_c4_g5~~TRINITY_DN3191_c4_g5_i2.p1  ORF type:complete len:501 (+),score=129.89 TRINITY_DN3191_c4_g5_i2:215-1717(+)
MTPPTQKVVYLADLSQVQKERYYNLLLKNNIQFVQNDSGEYVATLRIQKQKQDSSQPSNPIELNVVKDIDEEKRLYESPLQNRSPILYKTPKIKKQLAPSPKIKKNLQMQSKSKERLNKLNWIPPEDYSTFLSFFTSPIEQLQQPRLRAQKWISKRIEAILDSRWNNFLSIDNDEETTVDPFSILADFLPINEKVEVMGIAEFTYFHIHRSLGLSSLTNQSALEFLFNLVKHSSTDNGHNELVRLYSMFLNETLIPEQLIFFMYVRQIMLDAYMKKIRSGQKTFAKAFKPGLTFNFESDLKVFDTLLKHEFSLNLIKVIFARVFKKYPHLIDSYLRMIMKGKKTLSGKKLIEWFINNLSEFRKRSVEEPISEVDLELKQQLSYPSVYQNDSSVNPTPSWSGNFSQDSTSNSPLKPLTLLEKHAKMDEKPNPAPIKSFQYRLEDHIETAVKEIVMSIDKCLEVSIEGDLTAVLEKNLKSLVEQHIERVIELSDVHIVWKKI